MAQRRAILVRPLLAWYDENRRDLPWRQTKDPYAIWVSEVMLQQTQVATALPYYERWMVRFPSLQALASASEQEVLSMWQGLGYYKRARNLREGAQRVIADSLPCTASEWRTFPGVGRYTAGAIASNCFGERVAAVDGNTTRVFARLEACDLQGSALTVAAWNWAEAIVPKERSGDWNQALMELGARICKPQNPNCKACPLTTKCRAFKLGRVTDYPVRTATKPSTQQDHAISIPYCRGAFGVEQAGAEGWWEGMWQFPSPSDGATLHALGLIRHQVTRHKINLEVYFWPMDRRLRTLQWHPAENLCGIPLPAPHRKALDLALRYLAEAQN